MTIMKLKYVSLILLILLTSSVSARSRKVSIHNFLDNTRISQDGFAEQGNTVSISSSTYALQIGSILDYEVNNTVRVLNYYQRSQNIDFGFGQDPDDPSNWKATVDAVLGIPYLGINATKLQNFGIMIYLNTTASNLLYTNKSIGNQTVEVPSNLTVSRINFWYDYLSTGFILDYSIVFPILFLIDQLQEFQKINGTFTDFEEAVYSIRLLEALKQDPNDIELASKFIRAYATTSGLFSNSLVGAHTLKDTYIAILALDTIRKLNDLEYKSEIIKQILKQQDSNSGFREFGENQATLEATFYALQILSMLSAIDTLEQPDVLLTHGFISFDSFSLLFGFSILGKIALRRRSLRLKIKGGNNNE